MRVIIIIIIVGDLNTRECVTAIEDQYNFCKVRTGKIVGTAQMVRRMRTSQLKCTQTAAHTQATTSAELVRISRFPDLAAVGSSWVGLPAGRGLEGELYS